MKYNQYKIISKVWLYPGNAAWHFITIPKDISDDIKKSFGDRARGWGSIPVEVKLSSTTWKTSIFPDKKEGAYVLPLKAEVRKKENIHVGDHLNLLLEIRVNKTH